MQHTQDHQTEIATKSNRTTAHRPADHALSKLQKEKSSQLQKPKIDSGKAQKKNQIKPHKIQPQHQQQEDETNKKKQVERELPTDD